MNMENDQIESPSTEANHQSVEDASSNSTSIGPGEVYTCTFCLTTFPKQTMLINHVIRLHPFEEIPARLPLTHSPPPHTGALFCRFCEYYTMIPQHMLSHLKLHTGEYPFHCSFCPMKAMNVHDIKQHALSAHGKDTFEVEIAQHNNPNQFMGYKCSYCDYVQIVKSNTEEHIKKKHPDVTEKPIQVSLIRTSISHWLTSTVNKNDTVPESHKESKVTELPQDNDLGTNEEDKSSSSLEIISISDDDDSPVKSKPSSMEIVPIGKNIKDDFSCCFSPCRFKTSAAQYLKTHFRNIHPGSIPYLCHLCKFQTDHLEDFLQHYTKRNINGSCETGNRISLDKPYAEIGMRNQNISSQSLVAKNFKFEETFPPGYSVENLRNLFKCMQECCSFTTDVDVEFMKHISTLHPSESFQYFICCYCKAELINNPHLVCNHIKKEHGHCLHQCAFCFYRAVNRWYVYLHQQHRHPSLDTNIIKSDKLENLPLETLEGIKISSIMIPYRCAIGDCHYEEIDPNIFKQHHQSHHNGVTIIPCHHCKSEFLMVSSLISHYKIHGCNNFQCPHCLYGSETHEEMEFHLWNKHPNKAGQVFVRGSMDTMKRPNLVPLTNKVPIGNRCKVTLFEIQSPTITKPFTRPMPHPYNMVTPQSPQPSHSNGMGMSNMNTQHMHNAPPPPQPQPPPHMVPSLMNRYPVQVQPLAGTHMSGPPNTMPSRPQPHYSSNSVMNIQHQLMANSNNQNNIQNIPRILNVGSLSPNFKANMQSMGSTLAAPSYNNMNPMLTQPQMCQTMGMVHGPYGMHPQTMSQSNVPPGFRLPPPPQLHPAPASSPTSLIPDSKQIKQRPVTVNEMLQQKRNVTVQHIPPPPPLHPSRPHLMEIAESSRPVDSPIHPPENNITQTFRSNVKTEKANSLSCCQQSDQKLEPKQKNNEDIPLEWILDQIQALSGTKKSNKEKQNEPFTMQKNVTDIEKKMQKSKMQSCGDKKDSNIDSSEAKFIEEKLSNRNNKKTCTEKNNQENQNLISEITVENFSPNEQLKNLLNSDNNRNKSFEPSINRKIVEHKDMLDVINQNKNASNNEFPIKIKEEPASPDMENEIIDVGSEFSDLNEKDHENELEKGMGVIVKADSANGTIYVKTEKDNFEIEEDKFSDISSSSNTIPTSSFQNDELPAYVENFRFKCGVVKCPFEANEFSEFLTHYMQNHPKTQSEFTCKHCDSTFVKWEKFCGHLRLHGPSLFKCSSCPYIYWQKSDISKHCLNRHPPNSATVVTIRCGKRNFDNSSGCNSPIPFTKQQEVINVQDSGHPCYVSGIYECGVVDCNFATGSLDTFQNHLIAFHRHLCQIPCKYCKDSCFTVDKFLEHLHLHGPELYQCGLCDFLNGTKDSVEQHCAEIHRTHKLQIITIRPLKSDSSSMVGKQVQLKANMSVRKLYRCEFCDFSSESRDIMLDHLKQHTPIRPPEMSSKQSPKSKGTPLPSPPIRTPPFPASGNRLSSSSSGSVNDNGNFPFKKSDMWQCSRCTYTAKIRNDVINHFLRHINVKPFRCNHCGKCFYTIGDVSKHSQIVHTDMQKSYTRVISKDKIERLVGTANTFEPVGNNKMRVITGRRICPLCGYKTNKMPHLRRHLSSHLQYKPLKCFYCETRFFELTVLKSHHYQKHCNEALKYYKSNNKIEEAKYETLLKSVGIELSPSKDNIEMKSDMENSTIDVDDDESESEIESDHGENMDMTSQIPTPIKSPKQPLLFESNLLSPNLTIPAAKHNLKEKSGSSSENEAPDTMLFCNVELSVDEDCDKGIENIKIKQECIPDKIPTDSEYKPSLPLAPNPHSLPSEMNSNFMGIVDPRLAQIGEINQACATLFKSMFSAPVKCLTCGYQTIHGGSLVYHMRIHTSSIHENFQGETDDYPQFVPCVNTLICDINGCTFEAENYLDFKHHINGTHKNDVYPCGLCKAQFTVIEKMLQHRRLHGPNLFKCVTCGYIYWRKHDMTLHYTKKHPRIKPQTITIRQFLEEKPKKGDEALDNGSSGFSNIQSTDNPYMPGIPEYAASTFSCGNWDCDFVGDTACTLSNHYLTIHTGLKQFDCKHCNARYTAVKKFCQHLQLHGPSLFICSLCNYMHWRRKRVHIHGMEAHNTRFNHSNIVTVRHNAKTTIDDDFIEALTPPPPDPNMSADIPSLHMNDSMDNINVQAVNKQRIRCTMCPFVGATCTGFLEHLKVHGSYDYLMCGYCSIRTRNKSFMINHLSKIHSNQIFKVRPLFKQGSPNRIGGKRQWICKRCAYHAESFLDLMSHIKLNHATNKRYQCEACHKLFSNYGHCYRHWKTSHRDNGLPWKYEIVFVKQDTDFRYKNLNLNPVNNLQVLENMDNSYENTYQEQSGDGMNDGNQPFQQPMNLIHQQLQMQQPVNNVQEQFDLNNSFQEKADINIVKWVTRRKPRESGNSCCPYCNYRTDTRQHLRRHIGIHLGYKPYKCEYCNYTGIESYTIAKHIKLAHGDVPIKYTRSHNPKRVAQINKLVGQAWVEAQNPNNATIDSNMDNTGFENYSNLSNQLESEDHSYLNHFNDSDFTNLGEKQLNFQSWDDEDLIPYKNTNLSTNDSGLGNLEFDSESYDPKRTLLKPRPFIFKCKYCVYWSIEKTNALRHIKNVHHGKPLAVIRTENKNPTQRPIPFKYTAKSKKSKGYLCLHCKKLSVSKNGIYKHWLLFHREKTFKYKYYPAGISETHTKSPAKKEKPLELTKETCVDFDNQLRPKLKESVKLINNKIKSGPLSSKKKVEDSLPSAPLNSKRKVENSSPIGPLSSKRKVEEDSLPPESIVPVIKKRGVGRPPNPYKKRKLAASSNSPVKAKSPKSSPNTKNQSAKRKTIVGPLSVKMRLDPNYRSSVTSPARSVTPPPPRLNRQDELISEYEDGENGLDEMPELPTEEFTYYKKKNSPLNLSKITTMMSLGIGDPVKVSAKALDSILNLHPSVKVVDLKFAFLKR